MNSRHDSVVYSREPRGPGVDATFGEALTPLALRLLASLHRRFNQRRLSLAALREPRPGCGSDLNRNAPLSIRGEPVWSALFDFVLSICEAPRPNRGRFLAPVGEPRCDGERRLWIEVFAAAEEALSLRRGTVGFLTCSDSPCAANDSTPESSK